MGTTLVTTESQSLHESTSHASSDTYRKCAVTEANAPDDSAVQHKIVWRNVILFVYVHLAALYGLYLATVRAKGLTVFSGEY
jgi:stearoyl-CoA desaturase (delta-9 desaturase)